MEGRAQLTAKCRVAAKARQMSESGRPMEKRMAKRQWQTSKGEKRPNLVKVNCRLLAPSEASSLPEASAVQSQREANPPRALRGCAWGELFAALEMSECGSRVELSREI